MMRGKKSNKRTARDPYLPRNRMSFLQDTHLDGAETRVSAAGSICSIISWQVKIELCCEKLTSKHAHFEKVVAC